MPSVAATSSTNPAYTDNVAARLTPKTLGQGDFLKLLTTQMTNQDPMNPISDTNQIAQLAQFSSLQAMTSVATELASLRTDSQLQAAGSLLGRQVTVNTKDGSVKGTVESASNEGGKVYVSIAGQKHLYTNVTKVEPAPIPTAPAVGTP